MFRERKAVHQRKTFGIPLVSEGMMSAGISHEPGECSLMLQVLYMKADRPA